MSVSPSFKTFALEQLGRGIHGVRGKSMFGGDDTLYFKVDDSNRADFETRGMGPFQPFAEDGEVMHYYHVPDDLLDEVEELYAWAEKAIAVARRAKGRSSLRGAT
jgi:DNA transformation protein